MLDEEHAEWLTHMAFSGQHHKAPPPDVQLSLLNQNFVDRRIGGDVVTTEGWLALIKHFGGGNKDVTPDRRAWKIRRRDILRR